MDMWVVEDNNLDKWVNIWGRQEPATNYSMVKEWWTIQIRLFDTNFQVETTSFMIWGTFIATHKLLFIVMLPSRRTAIGFVQIVYDGVLGSLLDIQEDACKLVLMQDGTLVYRSNVLVSWRKSLKIEKIVWPPNSPDLNPIKNLLKMLKDVVHKKHRPKN